MFIVVGSQLRISFNEILGDESASFYIHIGIYIVLLKI